MISLAMLGFIKINKQKVKIKLEGVLMKFS